MRSKGAEIVCICDAWVPHSRQLTNDLRTDYMGSFTYDVITLGGEGVSKWWRLMTRGGGVWPMMTSSQKSKIFGILQGIFLKFSEKFTKSGRKFSTFQGNFYLNECFIIFMASHKKVRFWSNSRALQSFIGQVGWATFYHLLQGFFWNVACFRGRFWVKESKGQSSVWKV